MQKARRQIRRNVKEGIVAYEIPEDDESLLRETYEEEAAPDEVFEMDGKEKDENAEHYFEDSIVDYYARESKMNLDSDASAPTPEEIYPAFRESMMAWSPSTGTFHLRETSPPPRSSQRPVPHQQPSPPPPRVPTAYTASVYSRSAFGGGPSYAESSVPDTSNFPSAEERARAYRNLAAVGEEDEKHERRRTQNSKLSAEKITRWMDFS